MSQFPYQRVDRERIEAPGSGAAAAPGAAPGLAPRIRAWLILPLSVILCAAQATVTIVAENTNKAILTSTLIPVLAFAVLFVVVLLLNPLLRLIFRNSFLRPLNRPELMSVFAAMLVTAGVSTFGLTSQLIPLVPAPWNPEWNTPQRGWNEELLPHLNPKLYLSIPEDADPKARSSAGEVLGRLSTGDPNPDASGLGTPLSGPDAEDIRQAAGTLRRLLESPEQDVLPLNVKEASIVLDEVADGMDEPRRTELRGALETVGKAADRKIAQQNIRAFREGANRDQYGNPIRPPAPNASLGERLEYWKTVWYAIPWSAWLSPLAYWMIFIVACYGMFYCLTQIVLGQWSRGEKLTFPLAQLPEALIPEAEAPRAWIPRIFRSPGFWVGFLISFGILTWNVAVGAGWITGLPKLRLGMAGPAVENLIKGTAIEGLSASYFDFTFEFLIIFTAIGVAFLLPLEISFSSWFYFLVGKFILLVMVWMGYGKTAKDFPSDFQWTNNAMTALGGGGVLVFSAVSLYRSLREYFRLCRGRSGLQRVLLLLPVIGLAVALSVLIVWICWNWGLENITLGRFLWASLFVGVMMLMTLGLMRIVCEGGIYWIQAHAGFFHLWKAFGLGKFLSAALLAPLLPIYSVLFVDIKTFMAPNLLNAGKIQQDVGGSRFRFHLNIVLCILVSVVVAIAVTVFMAHVRGGQQMNSWFYSNAPLDTMERARRAVSTTPEFETGTGAWYGIGAVWVALTMVLRRTLLWFPHPIGFIMLINPLMTQLWFSFFLGWIFKKIVVKYGGKATFDKTRVIFIGLIMGELIAVCFWPIMSFFGQWTAGITLNRYGE